MKCWDKRSPLITVLIMKGLCSIPFFLVMIILYIVYTSVVEIKDYDCEDYCAAITGQSGDKTNFDLCVANAKSCYSPKDMVTNPIMGSISEIVFADDVAPAKFKCPAVIFTEQHVLTSSKCVDDTNMDEIYLRSASNFWSQGGIVHHIEKVLHPFREPTLVALEISPYFPMSKTIHFARIEENKEPTPTKTFGWQIDTKAKTLIGKKYAVMEDWNLQINRNCTTFDYKVVCHYKTNTVCSFHPGSPLLNDRNKIIGFLIEVNCNNNRNQLVFHYISRYTKWFKDALNFNNSMVLYSPCTSKWKHKTDNS